MQDYTIWAAGIFGVMSLNAWLDKAYGGVVLTAVLCAGVVYGALYVG